MVLLLSMLAKPLEIRRIEASGLHITWSDGLSVNIPRDLLRKNCPCAECKMARGDDSHSTPLTPKKSLLKIVEHTKDESLTLEAIWGVGQYALGMKWQDGHDSGIYTFPLLRELSETQEAALRETKTAALQD